jgi:hypothetical protein
MMFARVDKEHWDCEGCGAKAEIGFSCRPHSEEDYVTGIAWYLRCKPCGIGRSMTAGETESFEAAIRERGVPEPAGIADSEG